MTLRAEIVHHLYDRPSDLTPYCGVVPGPGDSGLGEGHLWHTGHDAEMLHAHYDIGSSCCMVCWQYVVEESCP